MISRLVEVSLLMGNRKNSKAVELIYLKINEFDDNNEYRRVYELSELTREILKSNQKYNFRRIFK